MSPSVVSPEGDRTRRRSPGSGMGSNVHELVVEGLRAGVPGREVLSGVDLVVRSGEVHAVMGPNGSGKSTLAHVLMGKPGYEVLGGTVTLDGQDVLALAAWERARLGLFLAPQDPTEVPGVRLTDVLSAALSPSGRRNGDRGGEPGGDAGGDAWVGPEVGATSSGGTQAREVLEQAVAEASRVGLEARLLDRALNVDLSGGERKRSETLQLAVLRPHIAVLDELDSGLDIDGLRDVAERVRAGVHEWGLGVLAITHYRRLLTALVPDVVHVLVNGRIVADGGPELAERVDQAGYAAF